MCTPAEGCRNALGSLSTNCENFWGHSFNR